MTERKCEHCHGSFKPVHGKQRFCPNPTCQKARYNANAARFRAAHPDYFKRWREHHPAQSRQYAEAQRHRLREGSRKGVQS